MLAAESSAVSGIVFVVAVRATSIVLVAAVAWASRQLLGLPVGTLRTFIGARKTLISPNSTSSAASSYRAVHRMTSCTSCS